MDVLFDGHDGQGDGVLSGYKKWTQANSSLGKLKPLCIGIVEYFSGSCEDKVKGGEDLSALEEIAVVLNRDKEVAAREKELEKDAKLARRMQNEEAEAANGFRTAGNGVGHPSNVPMGPGEVHGLSLLGRATNSSRESNGKIILSLIYVSMFQSFVSTPYINSYCWCRWICCCTSCGD
jgi:hypothetical protein